jgi:hypothetical protein
MARFSQPSSRGANGLDAMLFSRLELAFRIRSFASELTDLGIEPGNRVAYHG